MDNTASTLSIIASILAILGILGGAFAAIMRRRAKPGGTDGGTPTQEVEAGGLSRFGQPAGKSRPLTMEDILRDNGQRTGDQP